MSNRALRHDREAHPGCLVIVAASVAGITLAAVGIAALALARMMLSVL